MNEQILFFAVPFLLIAVILVIIKTILFFKATRKRSLQRWLYFKHNELVDTESNRISKLRKAQNRLSVVILIFFIIALAIIALIVRSA